MTTESHSTSKQGGIRFSVIATVLTVLAFLPLGWFFGRGAGLVAVLATGGACLLSCLALLVLSKESRAGNVGLLISTGIRMGLSLTICIVARELWPALGFVEFYLWVMLVYLVLLAVDTVGLLQTLPLSRKVSL